MELLLQTMAVPLALGIDTSPTTATAAPATPNVSAVLDSMSPPMATRILTGHVAHVAAGTTVSTQTLVPMQPAQAATTALVAGKHPIRLRVRGAPTA